jgi:hypothetical protein
MSWESKAKGLFTKKLISAADLYGKDLLISQYDDSFHTNVQTAADFGIPTMLFYPNDPEKLIQSGLNPDSWGDDQHEDLQNIINAVMVGGVTGVPRAVQGVMIDCSKVYTTDSKKLTAQWITETAAHLGSRIWALLKLPVWYYMNMEPITAWKDDANMLETLNTFIDNSGGIATVDWATLDGDIPASTKKPTLPYDGGKPWSFWFYHVDENVNIDVLAYADTNSIYGDAWLNFTPSSSSGDPSAGSGSDGDSGDSSTGSENGGTVVVDGTTNGYLAAILAKMTDIDSKLGNSKLINM